MGKAKAGKSAGKNAAKAAKKAKQEKVRSVLRMLTPSSRSGARRRSPQGREAKSLMLWTSRISTRFC